MIFLKSFLSEKQEQNGKATVYMLLRGLVFLVPAFVLVPKLISPQGMWLAVPVSECLTFVVILMTKKKDILST